MPTPLTPASARGMLAAAMLVLVLAAPASAKRPEVRLVLAGHDPVALCEGREEPGLESITADQGRWRYRFSSEANRTRFLSDPVRWGVQNGGACGKMGSLTGLGAPERWHVQDGRVYLFASESCRDRFRGAPERFVDAPDPVPSPTPEESARGRALLDRAAEGFGGAAAVDSVRTLRVTQRAGYAGRDSISHAARVSWWGFPGRHRFEERWSQRPFGHALDGGTGTDISGDTELVVDAQVLEFIRRDYWRNPFVIVRERRSPRMVVRAAGRDTIAGAQVELAEVAIDGATTTLAIDPASGRVLQARYRGRTSNGLVPVVTTFGDYRTVDGLAWPFGLASAHEGKPVESPRIETLEVRPNLALEAGIFRPAE